MNTLSPGNRALHLVSTRANIHGGFITPDDVAAIAGDPATRRTILLVRCGGGRFLAPAQDVSHFIDAIEKSGDDYVRDVSFPAEK